LLEQYLVSGHELAGHCVWVFEVALGRVVNDVFEANVESCRTELHREHLVGLVTEAVEKQGIDRCRFFTDDSGKRRAFGAVALTGCTQTAEQVDLERR